MHAELQSNLITGFSCLNLFVMRQGGKGGFNELVVRSTPLVLRYCVVTVWIQILILPDDNRFILPDCKRLVPVSVTKTFCYRVRELFLIEAGVMVLIKVMDNCSVKRDHHCFGRTAIKKALMNILVIA